MLTPGALFKMLVSRVLPSGTQDGLESEGYVRGGRYREANVLSLVRKSHMLAEERTWYNVQNAQTGIVEGTNVGFAITHPTLYLFNSDDPNDPLSKWINMDYIDLSVSTAGSTTTATQGKAFSLYLVKGNNYASGGTDLSSKITNINPLGAPSNDKCYFGALTTTDPAVSLGVTRVIVGQRVYRLPVTASTAPDAVGDRLRIEFGSVEAEVTGPLGTTGALMANVFQSIQKVPAVQIPPGWALHFCTWDLTVGGSAGTGTTWLPEAGWWKR